MLSNVMRGGVCWGLGFAALASAGAAHAQEAEAQDAYGAAHSKGHEALQLTLQGSLVDYVKQTVKPDKPEGSTIDPDELKTSSTSFGVLGPALGVGVGYAWDQVLFGVRANLANVDTSSPGGRDTSGTQISLLPRLEYMFNTDQTRPFIAGLVGIEHLSSTTPSAIVVQNGQLSTIGKTEDSATAFAIGAAFGVHAFLNHSVSLDPEFTLLYASGSGTVKDATEGVTDPQSQGYSLSAVRVLFSLGLSGWIDTAGAPTPPPPESVGTEAPRLPLLRLVRASSQKPSRSLQTFTCRATAACTCRCRKIQRGIRCSFGSLSRAIASRCPSARRLPSSTTARRSSFSCAVTASIT